MWKINFLKLNISIYYYLRASNVTIRILPDRTILIVTFLRRGFKVVLAKCRSQPIKISKPAEFIDS